MSQQNDNVVTGRFAHYRRPPAAAVEAMQTDALARRMSEWVMDAQAQIGSGPAENMLKTAIGWLRMKDETKWRGNR